MVMRDSIVPLKLSQGLLLFKLLQSLVNLFGSSFSRSESTSFVMFLSHFPFVIICLSDHFVSFVQLSKPFSEAYSVKDVTSDFVELIHPALRFLSHHVATQGKS